MWHERKEGGIFDETEAHQRKPCPGPGPFPGGLRQQTEMCIRDSYKTEVAGRPLTIDVGKVAELATASAMVTYGETTVLVAVTVSPVSYTHLDVYKRQPPRLHLTLTDCTFTGNTAGDKTNSCLLYTSHRRPGGGEPRQHLLPRGGGGGGLPLHRR